MSDLPIPMLGYDARLLARDTDQGPWSADAAVWLSLTEEDDEQNWEGFQYLWSSLADLTRRMHEGARKGEYKLIGIARVNPIIDVTDADWEYYSYQTYAKSTLCEADPYFAQTSWKLEGYDVCSYFLWSGLHRAAIDVTDQRSKLVLAQQWLNARGLLERLESARIVALELNDIDGAQAPFFPYAVFSLSWP